MLRLDEIRAGHQGITYTTYNTRGDVLETAVWGSSSDFAAWLSDAGGLDYGYGTYQPLTVTRTRYDAHGRAILSVGPTSWSRYVDANAKTPGTRTVYDSLGRVSRVERMENVKISIAMQAGWWGGGFFPDVASSTTGAVLSREATFYDAAGRVDYTTGSSPGAAGAGASSGDLAGNVTMYEYDRAGLQTAVIDGVGSRTRFGYDAAGRRLTVTDALGRVTREVLDALGRTRQVVLADGTTLETVYDAAGRRVAEVDALGRRTDYVHDAAGRLTDVLLPWVTDPQTNLQERPRYRFGYDDFGNLVQVRDPLESRDDEDQRVRRFSYDHLQRRVRATQPDGRYERHAYDAHGRLSATDQAHDTAGQRAGGPRRFSTRVSSRLSSRPGMAAEGGGGVG